MRKLLLGMFTVLALNVQGQSFGEPVTVEECDFAHFFVKSPFMYTTKESANKRDRIITVYNDEAQPSREFVLANTNYDKQGTGTKYGLITVRFRNGHDLDAAAITQTLFNDDDKLEFIRGTFKPKAGTPPYNYEITKAELINEDGKVLADLPVEAIDAYYINEAWVDLIQLGNNYYLYTTTEETSSTDEGEVSTLYKITKGGNTGVSFVKAAAFKSYPNPVRQNETFTIEVGEENVAPENFIELCDQSGRMIYRQAITGREVKVPTRHMKGLYIYNIISGGQSVSTGKVIVQ